LNNQQLLLVVEKPLTKILPELFEENNDMPSIYSNFIESYQKVLKRIYLHLILIYHNIIGNTVNIMIQKPFLHTFLVFSLFFHFVLFVDYILY
jgi:hypothetical protein